MPSKSSCSSYSMYVGLDLIGSRESVGEAIENCHRADADFALVDIRISMGPANFVRIDDLSSDQLNNSIVGRVNLMPHIQDVTAEVLLQCGWANHAGFYAILLDLSLLSLMPLCSVISDFMVAHPPEHSVTRIWISCKPEQWSAWNQIRTITAYPSKLAVCLDLSESLSDFHEAWFAEPVAAVVLPKVTKIPDSILLRFLRQNTQPIVRDPSQIPAILSIVRSFPALEYHETYISPYHDTLQLPLQPLRDEMENVVYETFEADKPKYDLYRDAIKKSISKISAVNCHIAVVGAGRGGLVEASLDAIRSLVDPDVTRRFTITCVEKNRFAAISLNHKLLHKWNTPNTPKIVIENIDMRDWRPGQKVDILVGELLGSLGDNEASPECLNASVMELLSPARGVSIPHRYFSSLEPVSAHKAWSQVRDMEKFQMPLVTLFHTHSRPSVEGPNMLFEFVHVRDSAANELEQSRSLTWTMAYDTCIHGFEGYFHCDLDEEGECVMSIDPRTATPKMVSWFPAFLPLQTPVYVQQGATVQLFVRRRSTKSRMWIEWTLIEPSPQPTNNLDGAFHSVGLI